MLLWYAPVSAVFVALNADFYQLLSLLVLHLSRFSLISPFYPNHYYFCQFLVLFQFTLFLCTNLNSVRNSWGPISTVQILVYGVVHDTVDCGKDCGIGLFFHSWWFIWKRSSKLRRFSKEAKCTCRRERWQRQQGEQRERQPRLPTEGFPLGSGTGRNCILQTWRGFFFHEAFL